MDSSDIQLFASNLRRDLQGHRPDRKGDAGKAPEAI